VNAKVVRERLGHASITLTFAVIFLLAAIMGD
jgi:hypothetical protein